MFCLVTRSLFRQFLRDSQRPIAQFAVNNHHRHHPPPQQQHYNQYQGGDRRKRPSSQGDLQYTKRRHFQLFSFEEELKKLKDSQEARFIVNLPNSNTGCQADGHKAVSGGGGKDAEIHRLNQLYRDGSMINEKNIIIPSAEQSSGDTSHSFLGLTITQAFLARQDILSIEKSLVLETFLLNVLLLHLIPNPAPGIKAQQLKHTQQKELQTYIVSLLANGQLLEIVEVSQTTQLFRFIVKTLEMLNIKHGQSLPFIESYLESVSNAKNSNKSIIASLSEASLLLLPVSDYVQASNADNLNISGLGHMIRGLLTDLVASSQPHLEKQKKKTLSDINKSKDSSIQLQLSSGSVSALSKILFCLVRISGGEETACLDVAKTLVNSGSFSQMSEIEMTSLVYSISKLRNNASSQQQEGDSSHGISIDQLITDYEYKVEQMLANRLKPFPYSRVPYILYCLQHATPYRLGHRRPKVQAICRSLSEIAMANYDKYKSAEITTILYSLKLIDPLAFAEEIIGIYRAYFLKLALDKQNVMKGEVTNDMTAEEVTGELKDDQNEERQDFLNQHMNRTVLLSSIEDVKEENKLCQRSLREGRVDKTKEFSGKVKKDEKKKISTVSVQGVGLESLQAVDILCLLIAVREKDSRGRVDEREKGVNEKVSSVKVINQQLLQVFLGKKSQIPSSLVIKIMYEIAYNHGQLLDSYVFEMHCKDWVIKQTDKLTGLNNHDFIAMAFILKKFTRLFGYHLVFWTNFAQEVALRRQFNQQIEIQKVNQLLENMISFASKCLLTATDLKKQDTNRVAKIQTLREALTLAADSLKNKSLRNDDQQQESPDNHNTQ